MKTIADHTIHQEKINQVWQLLQEVCDPEIPVLTIIDLGIVRNIFVDDTEQLIIQITPTYSGCPAMDAISVDIKLKLIENGIQHFKVQQILSPAWTTDWMSETGKAKLNAYGIAPPSPSHLANNTTPACPQCHSNNTKLLSQFGSTSCKALYQCNDCKEPFDYFKCH